MKWDREEIGRGGRTEEDGEERGEVWGGKEMGRGWGGVGRRGWGGGGKKRGGEGRRYGDGEGRGGEGKNCAIATKM